MQAPPTSHNETIVSNHFKPHPWFRNNHLQTLWSRLAKYQCMATLHWHEFPLPDGDFVDLAWSDDPVTVAARPAPLVVIFHGLEGSARSSYADQLMLAARQQGWYAVVMHFRSCSGRPNRLARAYHSGDTGDARYFLQHLAEHFPNNPLFTAGYSLGGNMLVKLLAESPELPIVAASAVSPPLALAPSSVRVNKGWSRMYRNHLLNQLKQKTWLKLERGIIRSQLSISERTLLAIRDFPTFDNLVTAPLHGFADADDYYQQCSGLQFLPQVQHPLLVVHAKDDPFTCAASIPHPNQLSPQVHYELQQRGGHVGFIEQRQGKATPWLPPRLMHWFSLHTPHNK
ncbi:hydrolase [Aliidiomarina taiwanensis]|uniref:Hydrolase n=1 Tax=Aliidiomarina taiwanensis TaxID=946228 RepID=A0A432X7K4_9GAMM|nr:hydrolase [Aliidiomarina taiwanensis]RUO42777.1 hydrolase [Aliidiomarina taiwanensis]